jgi:hypothetical protein
MQAHGAITRVLPCLVLASLQLTSFATALAGAAAPDPNCTSGVASAGLCCAKECGVCGGHGCGARPGGASECCSNQIEASGRKCSVDPPPCVMDGGGGGGGGGGGWPPPDPSNKTVEVAVVVGGVVGAVSDRFVSFNLDTGWVSMRAHFCARAHPLTHPPTHPPHTCTHSLPHRPTRACSLTRSTACPLAHSLTHSLTHHLVHLLSHARNRVTDGTTPIQPFFCLQLRLGRRTSALAARVKITSCTPLENSLTFPVPTRLDQ